MILFVTEQIGVPQGTLSVHSHVTTFPILLQSPISGGIFELMKLESSTKDGSAFKEALARISLVSRDEMEKRLEQSPKEPVSRHKRYKYAPAAQVSKP
jgi:hypothetical protein